METIQTKFGTLIGNNLKATNTECKQCGAETFEGHDYCSLECIDAPERTETTVGARVSMTVDGETIYGTVTDFYPSHTGVMFDGRTEESRVQDSLLTVVK